MSVRLVTTPWFTKNFAAGAVDTAVSWGTDRRRWTVSMVRSAGLARTRRIRPRIIPPCCSRSTSATRTSRSACSGPARSSRHAARRRARDRRPTRSSCCSTASCASTTRPSPTSRAIAAAPSCPSLTAAIETIAERRERPLLVAAAGTVPIAIRIDRPAEVGADRLVNALAAARLHGTPAVVVDFGTATTFDCVGGRRRLRRRGDRARPRAGPRGARRADGEAAADRAADAGPGDRPRHGRRDPVRDGPRLPGAGERAARPDPRASSPTRPASSPAESRSILTGGLSAAPWATGLDGVDAIDPDLTLKGLAILHAEVGGGEPLELGLSVMTRSTRALGRLDGRLIAARRHRLDRRLQGRRAAPRLLRAEGADVVVLLTPSATRFVGAADVRGAEPPPGRDRRRSRCCPTAGSATSSSPTRPTRSSSPRRPPTGSARWRTAWPATR